MVILLETLAALVGRVEGRACVACVLLWIKCLSAGFVVFALINVFFNRALLTVLVSLYYYLNIFLTVHIIVISIAVKHVFPIGLFVLILVLFVGGGDTLLLIVWVPRAFVVRLLVIFVIVYDILPLWSLALWWLGPALLLLFGRLCILGALLVARFSFLRHEQLCLLDDLLPLF